MKDALDQRINQTLDSIIEALHTSFRNPDIDSCSLFDSYRGLIQERRTRQSQGYYGVVPTPRQTNLRKMREALGNVQAGGKAKE